MIIEFPYKQQGRENSDCGVMQVTWEAHPFSPKRVWRKKGKLEGGQ